MNHIARRGIKMKYYYAWDKENKLLKSESMPNDCKITNDEMKQIMIDKYKLPIDIKIESELLIRNSYYRSHRNKY
jgi:hypothetical protein